MAFLPGAPPQPPPLSCQTSVSHRPARGPPLGYGQVAPGPSSQGLMSSVTLNFFHCHHSHTEKSAGKNLQRKRASD